MGKKDATELGNASGEEMNTDLPADRSTAPLHPDPDVVFEPERRMDYWRSWAVLVAGTMVFVVSFGMVTSYGIYVEHLLDAFHCSKSEVALVGSVAYGCMCICGPFSNVLYQLIGSRLSIMIGSLIACGGYIIAFGADSIMHLAVCYGVVGVGLGITITPTLAAQTEYFLKYRYFAISFITVGSAAGLFIIPPVLERVINHYGWRGSMLINAGLALQLIISGAIMRSTRPKLTMKTVKCAQIFHLSLFRGATFLLLCVTCTMWGATNYTYLTTLPSFMENSGGLSKQVVALLMSIVGIGSILGRVSASVINQQTGVNRPLLYATALFISTCQVWLTVLCGHEAEFGVVGFFFGFGFGLMLTTLAPVVVDLFGVAKLPGAQGFLAFFVGAGGLVGPVIAGSISDSIGPTASFLFAGSLGLCGVVVSFMIVILNCIRPRKLSQNYEGDEPNPEDGLKNRDEDAEFMDAVEEKIAEDELSQSPMRKPNRDVGGGSPESGNSASDSEESEPMMTPQSYRIGSLTQGDLTESGQTFEDEPRLQSDEEENVISDNSEEFVGIPGFSGSFEKRYPVDIDGNKNHTNSNVSKRSPFSRLTSQQVGLFFQNIVL